MGVLSDIAGQTQPKESLFVATGALSELIVGENIRRYALGFGPQGGPTYGLSTIDDATGHSGFVLPGFGLVWLTVKDYGAFVQSAWYATNCGLGQRIAVFELILPRE